MNLVVGDAMKAILVGTTRRGFDPHQTGCLPAAPSVHLPLKGPGQPVQIQDADMPLVHFQQALLLEG